MSVFSRHVAIERFNRYRVSRLAFEGFGPSREDYARLVSDLASVQWRSVMSYISNLGFVNHWSPADCERLTLKELIEYERMARDNFKKFRGGRG